VTETRGAPALPDREPGRGRGGRSVERAGPVARLSLFYRQVVAELRKVIWPTRKELITYTSVVIVFVLAVMAFVSLLDLIFGQAVLWVFG
jgi:preprotein translocase subunit SecE